jgi:hypothetical protein
MPSWENATSVLLLTWRKAGFCAASARIVQPFCRTELEAWAEVTWQKASRLNETSLFHYCWCILRLAFRSWSLFLGPEIAMEGRMAENLASGS